MIIASVTFLFIFLASFCNAENDTAKSTHIDMEFDDEFYDNYNDIPKLDDTRVFGPNAVRDFYVIMIFGLFALLSNLFGSLYVIYRTYLQLRRGGRNNVPLSLRFPFYIALTDAFLSLTYTINLVYTLIWKLPWANPACKIIGASVTTFFTLNMFLVGIIALTTYSYVCREYYVEFGVYDYKLWFVTLALSVAVIALSIDKSGQQKYWCAGRHHSVFVPIAMIIFIIVILLTILTCYIKVLLKIRKNDDVLISSYQRPVEKRALRKLISYIFTFILQFIPLLAYNFFALSGIENLLLDVLAITALNFGGIGNFIQFAINEGLWNSNKLNSLTSSMEQNIPSTVPKAVTSMNSITMRETEDHTNVNINNYFDNSSNFTSGDVIYNDGILSPEEENHNENMMEINNDNDDDDLSPEEENHNENMMEINNDNDDDLSPEENHNENMMEINNDNDDDDDDDEDDEDDESDDSDSDESDDDSDNDNALTAFDANYSSNISLNGDHAHAI